MATLARGGNFSATRPNAHRRDKPEAQIGAAKPGKSVGIRFLNVATRCLICEVDARIARAVRRDAGHARVVPRRRCSRRRSRIGWSVRGGWSACRGVPPGPQALGTHRGGATGLRHPCSRRTIRSKAPCRSVPARVSGSSRRDGPTTPTVARQRRNSTGFPPPRAGTTEPSQHTASAPRNHPAQEGRPGLGPV